MRKFQAKVYVNKKLVKTVESEYTYGCVSEAVSHLSSKIWEGVRAAGPDIEKEGEEMKVAFNVQMVLKCLVNRRAQRRAPDVIAAEKAAMQVARDERAARLKEQEEREVKRRKMTRIRISHQVSHAFMVGKSGSEPVSKYITCSLCHAPADLIYLDATIPKGASVLNEDSIFSAVCNEHHQPSTAWWRNPAAQIVPCSHLEFFYEGIRQIAIKAGVA
jgi:hypothetical protein